MSSAPSIHPSEGFKVFILSGEMAGQEFVFSQASIKIGRGPENDITLASDPKVSREHAEIRVNPEGLWITNISERNKLYIDGNEVSAGPIANSQLILLGETQIRVQSQSEGKSAKTSNSPITTLKAVTKSQAKTVPDSHALALQRHQQMAIHYQAPPPSGMTNKHSKGAGQPQKSKPSDQGTLLVRIILVAVILIGAFFYTKDKSSTGSSSSPSIGIRTSEEIQQDQERARMSREQIESIREEEGRNTQQFRSAQSYYIRGFRDYQQGQYRRAVEAFDTALSFFPNHTLARRYRTLAQRRLDEFIQYNMIEGRRYRERNNHSMCAAAFRNVMTVVRDQRDPTYIQAKENFDECMIHLRERY